MNFLDLGRNWQFSKDFEARLMAVTPSEVSAAFRKYIDPEQMTLVIAGDTRKGIANGRVRIDESPQP
jgi:zinc protease